MQIEYTDTEQRKHALARMIGIEDRVYVTVDGQPRIYAIADEDLDRENDEKTSAVHFVRFQFTPAMIAAIKKGVQVTLGCDHASYPATVVIPSATLASLVEDLK